MCPKEAGFLLLMNDVDGKAIPDEPMDEIEPKSESYKLPKPKTEYGEVDTLWEKTPTDWTAKNTINQILFFILVGDIINF